MNCRPLDLTISPETLDKDIFDASDAMDRIQAEQMMTLSKLTPT
jgi:hypothetical protein